MTARSVPLYRAAHGRTGDKGNRSNISVIAWHPALWPLLVEQVSEARVAAQFAHRRPRQVTRHLLPSLAAMNFVLDDDKARAERLPREVTALYTCGPAGGGGVRTGLRQRLSTRSCFVPRGDVPARFVMMDAA